MKTRIKPDAARNARVFGCTIEQAKRMFIRNADSLREMAEKAERTGKPVNGYTALDLRESERDYRQAAI